MFVLFDKETISTSELDILFSKFYLLEDSQNESRTEEVFHIRPHYTQRMCTSNNAGNRLPNF